MNKKLAVVAALLLVSPVVTDVAAAAENPNHLNKDAGASHKQKRAEKILLMMKALGISDPDITALVHDIDKRSRSGYLMLHEEKISGGSLSLRYTLEPRISTKQIELHYAPDNSNTEYSVRTNAVMVKYRLKF